MADLVKKFLANLPICNVATREIVATVNLEFLYPKTREGYTPVCCLDIDGNVVIKGDTISLRRKEYVVSHVLYSTKTVVMREQGKEINVTYDDQIPIIRVHRKCRLIKKGGLK